MLGLFRDPQLEAFARDLAKEFSRRLPPQSVDPQRAADPKFKLTLAKALHHVFASVLQYRDKHHLGVLKKARLSKVFQDELAAIGYGEEFVKEVTLALAEQLTQS